MTLYIRNDLTNQFLPLEKYLNPLFGVLLFHITLQNFMIFMPYITVRIALQSTISMTLYNDNEIFCKKTRYHILFCVAVLCHITEFYDFQAGCEV